MAQEGEQQLSLLNILKEAQEYIQILIKKIEHEQSLQHYFDGESVVALEKKLDTLQKKYDELKRKTKEFDWNSSSSRDARKMYGDVTPGDTTHQDVVLLYQNYFKTAFRNLPKELAESKEERYKVWGITSAIVQESFNENKDAIINKMKEELTSLLQEGISHKGPLDEAKNDLFRAFNMYIKERGQQEIEAIKRKLLHQADRNDRPNIKRAAEVIEKLDPKYYYSFFNEEIESVSLEATAATAQCGLPTEVRIGDEEKNTRRPMMISIPLVEAIRKPVETIMKPVETIIKPLSKLLKSSSMPDNESIASISEKLHRNITEARMRIDKMESLEKQIEELESEIKEVEERLIVTDDTSSMSLPRFSDYASKDEVKYWHKKYVSELLEKLGDHLMNCLLDCRSSDVMIERSDTRETYKIYGLLLSACNLRELKPQCVVEKVLGAIQVEECASRYSYDVSIIEGAHKVEAVKKYVQEAVDLTYKMLTLLPPLVVTVYPEEYKEELHDTNRLTWDESGGSHKLVYYRPILVYGNQSHVAMKGLVGNQKM